MTTFTITAGRDYVYTADQPDNRRGHRYRVERFIKDVPSYQEKVLMHCLSGPDRGLWFCVTPQNFIQRYQPAANGTPIEPEPEPVQEKIAGFTSESWRSGA